MHISAHGELSAYISIFCSFVSNRSLLSYFLLCLHIRSDALTRVQLFVFKIFCEPSQQFITLYGHFHIMTIVVVHWQKPHSHRCY